MAGENEPRGDRRTDLTLKITCIGLFGENIDPAFHALVYGKDGDASYTEAERLKNETAFAKAFVLALRGPDVNEAQNAVRALLRANKIETDSGVGEALDAARAARYPRRVVGQLEYP